MSTENMPEYLYHYTSLSSLALILKNRNIRFNSLVNLDDQEERIFSDMKDYGKYCFVSSWTDCSDEKLSLWSMYTKNVGVRIKLHTLPFETYTYSINNGNLSVDICDNFWPSDWFQKDSITFVPFPNDKVIVKVVYTDNEELLSPKLRNYSKESNLTEIKNSILGVYKRKEWKFQDEIRYRIIFFPATYDDCLTATENDFEKWFTNLSDLPFNDRFLKIKQEYFNEIEIMTGPLMNEGDKELLNLLVKNYCPSAISRIKPSKFTGKLKA